MKMNKESTIHVEPTIITRELKAPASTIFDAWTDEQQLVRWMFPQPGFTCEFPHADIRPGGTALQKMTAPNGYEMFLFTSYEEIDPPYSLSFRQFSCDSAGNFLPNPKMPDWPREMRTTIKLEENGEITKLTLLWEPVDPTRAEADAFEASRSGHGDGWGAGLDQLRAYLEGR